MTDPDDASYDDLRHLLADARVTTPIPDDVAARLDATLADLVADRHVDLVPEPDATVVALRPRSRLAPRLLVAAAAVVLVGAGGVGLNQVLENVGASNDSAATSAEAGGAPVAPAAPGSSPQPTSEDASGVTGGPGAATADAAVPAFSSMTFASDVQGFVSPPFVARLGDSTKNLDTRTGRTPEPTAPSESATRSGRTDTTPGALDDLSSAYAAKACPGPTDPAGKVVMITFDGAPAALVVGPLENGLRLVLAWSCDGSTVLASTALDR